MSTRTHSRRMWHVNHVMGFGLSMSQAFALCKKNNWFGDPIAQAVPTERPTAMPGFLLAN